MHRKTRLANTIGGVDAGGFFFNNTKTAPEF
jgi:hypothetical protein